MANVFIEKTYFLGYFKSLEKKKKIKLGVISNGTCSKLCIWPKREQEYKAGYQNDFQDVSSNMILCKAMHCSKLHYPVPQKRLKFHKVNFRANFTILINFRCLKQWSKKTLNEQSSSFLFKIFLISEYGASRNIKKYFRPQWTKVLVYCTEIYIWKFSQFAFWKFTMD